MNTSASSLADAVPEFAKTFTGQLIRPTDPTYEDVRRIHNGLVDKRPALIARCAGESDLEIVYGGRTIHGECSGVAATHEIGEHGRKAALDDVAAHSPQDRLARRARLNQRVDRSPERIRRLEEIGFEWRG